MRLTDEQAIAIAGAAYTFALALDGYPLDVAAWLATRWLVLSILKAVIW